INAGSKPFGSLIVPGRQLRIRHFLRHAREHPNRDGDGVRFHIALWRPALAFCAVPIPEVLIEPGELVEKPRRMGHQHIGYEVAMHASDRRKNEGVADELSWLFPNSRLVFEAADGSD